MPLLKRQHLFQNRGTGSELNYSIIDGFSMDSTTAKKLNYSGMLTIVLATDGYSELYNTLNKSEAILSEILSNDSLLILVN